MKNIVIIGSTGMLGNTAREFFSQKQYKVHCIDRVDIDLSKASYDDIENELKKISEFGFEYILNCSAVTKIGLDEQSDTIKMNSVIPLWLSDISNKLNMKLIHISTNGVFSGLRQCGNYSELDEPDAKDVYGISKYHGEPPSSTVIRCSIVGEEKDTVKSVLSATIKNPDNNVNGDINVYWNGLTCLHLLNIIHEHICNDSLWDGVRHFYSNTISWYEMIKTISDVYKLNKICNPVYNKNSRNRTLVSTVNPMESVTIKEQLIKQRQFWLNK